MQMSYVSYEALPLPAANISDPEQILDMYRQTLDHRLPGFVVRQATLDQIDSIVNPLLVVPDSAFSNTQFRDHEQYLFAPMADAGVHIDALPKTENVPAPLHHHRTEQGSHSLTLGSLTGNFVELAQDPAEAKQVKTLRSQLRTTIPNEVYNPNVVNPQIYNGLVAANDVAIIRITGSSPTIHDFFTILPRDARIRGYAENR